MCWSHVAFIVLAAESQRNFMFQNPTLSNAVNLALAQNAHTLVSLPDLQAKAGRHVLALCGADIVIHLILPIRAFIGFKFSAGM